MITIQKLNVHLGVYRPGGATHADVAKLLSSVLARMPGDSEQEPVRAPARSLAPDIGSHWEEQGGTYLGIMRGAEGKPRYHLIAADTDDGLSQPLKWGGYGEEVDGTKCRRDGLANTLALITDPSGQDHPAAQWAHGLVIGEHSDFYLPSQMETQLGVIHAPHLFGEGIFWTSTQCSASRAWVQGADGLPYILYKNFEFRARAFRRSLIE